MSGDGDEKILCKLTNPLEEEERNLSFFLLIPLLSRGSSSDLFTEMKCTSLQNVLLNLPTNKMLLKKLRAHGEQEVHGVVVSRTL